ncbi:phage baseplate assembly protein V [Bacteroides fragilis]|nr:phage baseplate assembly protein V [Bacteroides fragilis]
MDCYVEQNLNTIVSDILDKSGVKMNVTNNPKHTDIIPYVARYKETSYGFLSRLLRSYGEWFYYNGETLQIGDPEIDTESRAGYDVDLTSVNINATIRSLNHSTYEFDPVNDKFYYDYSGTPKGATLGSRSAEKCSEPIFPTEARLPSIRPAYSAMDLEHYGDAGFHRNYSQLSQMRATSRYCGIRLGELVVTRVPESFPGVKIPDLGRYRITEITHTVNSKGQYSNTFCGVPGGTPVMPWGDAVMPVAYPEMARVLSNDDPKNQGRVKVQFMWQEIDGGESYWMRVQSPDAGKSEQVAKNRGFVFIPEPGDLVMVGFEQGNPDRPYVTGSLFYKANSEGAGTDNSVKSIRTRSGHTLEFNDDEGGNWGITIKDGNGCILHLDTKGKNIEITAPETLSLTAKNVSINAEENVQIAAKQNIDVTAEADINIAAKGYLMQQTDGDLSVSAKGSINAEAKTDVSLSGQNTTVDGKTKVTVSGAETLVSGKMTTVQGAAHKIDVM